jgi:hypothetical protein
MPKDAPRKFKISGLGSNLSELYYRQIVGKSDKCNVFLVKDRTSVVYGSPQNDLDW